ncbi:MAG: lipopolysaccharide heptosyltransferase II [Desulfamplus sp.]|nr:lipopolysaccharide heptosyltransferase II [Desulfamplus sp.]
MCDNSKVKILIRAANWIGDAIMTTPVIRAIRKNYPDAHIVLLAKPWVIPVFDHNPHIDEIMVYENSSRHTKGLGTLRLARDIRLQRFDIAILMQNAFEAALICFLAGIPVRIGYNTDGRSLLLNPSVKMDKKLKKGHLIDYYRGILRGAGQGLCVNYGRDPDLPISDMERRAAEAAITSYGIDLSKPVIGINPGATGGTAKRWFPHRYAELAKRLADRFKTKILIFGGPSDEELGDSINAESGGICINIAGKTTLRQAFAMIEKCNLFITNDSGLMHAAAALGTNQIAIIGSTDPVATAPSSPNSFIIRVPVMCSPCLEAHCPKKQSDLNHHVCMDKVSVEMVFKKSEAIMQKAGYPKN